jgi:hypothetical protein
VHKRRHLEKHLHIISSTTPFPADYGNMVDRFYKLPALAQEGVRIHLHCFGPPGVHERWLQPCCHSIHYYERQVGHKGFSMQLPYMVASRKNELLLANLLQDDYPILMEGIHCTYPLLDERFAGRRCFVRLQHVQYLYYKSQQQYASSFLKKMYYWHQSRLLYQYEKKLYNRAVFWTTLSTDRELLHRQLGYRQVAPLPLFIPDWQVQCREGSGTYCLYHGDLDIESNEKAAIWLLKNVFRDINIPFLIAGKNPSPRLDQLVRDQSHTCLIANPSDQEMRDLIAKAHIHLLPSLSHTGLSGKLLNALFNGRHCIVNPGMIRGTGLSNICHVADGPYKWMQLITELYQRPFSVAEGEKRQKVLHAQFNNRSNARQVVQWIWES